MSPSNRESNIMYVSIQNLQRRLKKEEDAHTEKGKKRYERNVEISSATKGNYHREHRGMHRGRNGI